MFTGISGSKTPRSASTTCASITSALIEFVWFSFSAIVLLDSQLDLGLMGDAALVPGRLPDQIHNHFPHSGDARNLTLNVFSQHLPHAAARRSEREFDLDFTTAARERCHRTAVNQ